jgi:BlaI family transcriptional regulator, penicillinase repressor
MDKMKRLTPAEEQVMLRLWGLQQATVQDIINFYPAPKPAYNTTSTIVRILEKKGFVKHKKQGKGYLYMPKVSKMEYRNYLADWMLDQYFDCSTQEAINYFNTHRSLEELL